MRVDLRRWEFGGGMLIVWSECELELFEGEEDISELIGMECEWSDTLKSDGSMGIEIGNDGEAVSGMFLGKTKRLDGWTRDDLFESYGKIDSWNMTCLETMREWVDKSR